MTGSAVFFAQNNSKMKSINYSAPVWCSKSIAINASNEKVWLVLTNINSWPSWQPEITNSKIKGALKPETTFDWKSGGASIRSTIHTVDPFTNFGWTGKTFGLHAIHNWNLQVKDGQTIVSVAESMDGFIAKLFKGPFNRNLEKGMHRWLGFLKKECEMQ